MHRSDLGKTKCVWQKDEDQRIFFSSHRKLWSQDVFKGLSYFWDHCICWLFISSVSVPSVLSMLTSYFLSISPPQAIYSILLLSWFVCLRVCACFCAAAGLSGDFLPVGSTLPHACDDIVLNLLLLKGVAGPLLVLDCLMTDPCQLFLTKNAKGKPCVPSSSVINPSFLLQTRQEDKIGKTWKTRKKQNWQTADLFKF